MRPFRTASVFFVFQRGPSRTITHRARQSAATPFTSSCASSLHIAMRLRVRANSNAIPHPLERRHLSIWPSATSTSSTQSPTVPRPAPSSDVANQSAAWTQDPWNAESGSVGAPSSDSSALTIPEAFSSHSTSLLGLVQHAPVSPPALILDSTPTNSPTNLPIDGNHIGDLANLGLGGWGPVGLIQNILEQIHVYTGVPWWATVVFLSVATRAILSPMLIRGMGRSARFLDIRERVERIVSSAKDATPEEKIKASLEAREIMKKHDASPFGSLVPMLAQAGIVFTVFLALQGMAQLPVESLKNGGLGWFQDLTVPDPTYYLPALASLVFLGGLEATEMPNDPNSNRSKNIGRIFIVVGFFILKAMPAGVVLYIGSNGILQVVQGLFLRIPGVRQRLRIPLSKPSNKPPSP